jgi:hypothetical protein
MNPVEFSIGFEEVFFLDMVLNMSEMIVLARTPHSAECKLLAKKVIRSEEVSCEGGPQEFRDDVTASMNIHF